WQSPGTTRAMGFASDQFISSMVRHPTMADRPIGTDRPIRLGFLSPDHSAEDDYPRIAARIRPIVDAFVVHTSIGEDAHREDALRDTGDTRRLLEGAEALDRIGVDAAMWACTSGSF